MDIFLLAWRRESMDYSVNKLLQNSWMQSPGPNHTHRHAFCLTACALSLGGWLMVHNHAQPT